MVIFFSRDFLYEDIHERQFDTGGEEWSLRSELNADGSSGEDLLVLRFTHEVSCIGLEQRNASFLTSVGFSLDNVESWFGVLSLSWEESVDTFVSSSDSSLSGVSSLGILLAGAPCSASSKCTTMTLVLSARSSLSRHLDNARWINLSRKIKIISNYRLLIVVERMIEKNLDICTLMFYYHCFIYVTKFHYPHIANSCRGTRFEILSVWCFAFSSLQTHGGVASHSLWCTLLLLNNSRSLIITRFPFTSSMGYQNMYSV